MANENFKTLDPRGSFIVLFGSKTETTPHSVDYEVKTAIKEIFTKFCDETADKKDTIDQDCIDELLTMLVSQAEMAINRVHACQKESFKEFIIQQWHIACGSVPWPAEKINATYFQKYAGEMVIRSYFTSIKTMVDNEIFPRPITKQTVIRDLQLLLNISRELVSTMAETKACA